MAGAVSIFVSLLSPETWERKAAEYERAAEGCRRACLLQGRDPSAGVARWLDRAANCRAKAAALRETEG
jgi:hypothetical protein